MKTRVCLLSVLASFALASSARADAPAWCKGTKGEEVPGAGYWDRASKDDPLDAVPAIVSCLCAQKCGSSSDDFAQHGAAVEEARRKWSKRLEMSDDDWADAAEWATVMISTRQDPADVRPDSNKAAWSSLDPVGQYILLNWTLPADYDANYIADALGPKLSESGRLAYINRCLLSRERVVQWAMCQPDIDVYDGKKVAAEIHADSKHNGFQKFMVRLAMDKLRSRLADHANEVKQETAKDPAYAKMFAIAAETRKQWDKIWSSDGALVELALTMDDARVTNSRRAFAGCDDKTWPAFKSAVATIAAKQFANIDTNIETYLASKGAPLVQAAQIVVATPKGYLAAVAHALCHVGDKKWDALIRAIGESVRRYPGFRGPRNATQVAIASAGLELDDRSARIEYPGVNREFFPAEGGSSGGGNGVIKTMKPQGDTVHIEFATVKDKEPRCTKYAYTRRLVGIDSSGRFIYESGCAKETMVLVDHTSSPVNVTRRYAEGLRPGMKVFVTEDVVDVAWPHAGTATPNFIGGAPVK